jgi:hypothetical protein
MFLSHGNPVYYMLFSAIDEAFIVQKKNHFQLTCHVVKEKPVFSYATVEHL